MRRKDRRPLRKIQCNHTIPYLTVSYSTVVLATLELLTITVTFHFGDITSVT